MVLFRSTQAYPCSWSFFGLLLLGHGSNIFFPLCLHNNNNNDAHMCAITCCCQHFVLGPLSCFVYIYERSQGCAHARLAATIII